MPTGLLCAATSPSIDAWWQVFGRLHPMLLHFPIALIMLGAALAALRWCMGKGDQPSSTIQFCLWGGLFFAAITVWAGWELAEEDQYRTKELMDWHRWISIGALGAVALAAVFDLMRRSPRWPWALPARLLAFLLAAILVAVGGHLGASMKWGSNFVLKPLEKAQAAEQPQETPQATEPASDTPGETPGEDPGESPQEPTDTGASTSETAPETPAPPAAGWDTVVGLLEGRCEKCHGTDTQKGGLQILPWTALFAGDRTFWVVAPGEPEASLLLDRVSLPETDDDRMPPEGEGDMLNPAERDLIRAWIAAGAHGPGGEAPPAEAPAPEPASPAGPASPDTGARTDPASVLPGPFDQAAEDVAIAAMRMRGIRIGPLHVGSPWLQVDLSRLDPPANDADCDGLGALAGNLWSCSLAGTDITDAAMTQVALCQELRDLRLDGTAITDAGIGSLKPLVDLEMLNCWNTKLTDGCVTGIAALPGLRVVYLGSTGMTDEGLEALRKARPDLAVHGEATLPQEAPADAPA